jgi:hypothetical protein
VRPDEVAHRIGDLVLGDRDDRVEISRTEPDRDAAGLDVPREPVGERLAELHLDDLAGGDGRLHCG